MRLDDLFSDIDHVVIDRSHGFPHDMVVDWVSIDHRDVRPGTLFCALEGANFDGHLFLNAAAEKGAVAALVSRSTDSRLPQIVLREGDPRRVLAVLADRLYQHPSAELTLLGVTGTNGKTTVTHLLSKILNICGIRTEALGTLWGRLTTPEAPELQRKLREFISSGVSAVAMEVSSHSLVMHRVDQVSFAAAIFTNLTQDHLDFHGDMESYFSAKALLFDQTRSRFAVVNADDPYGGRLMAVRSDAIPFSQSDISGLELGPHGLSFDWRGRRVVSELFGRHNVYNILAAMTTLSELGIDDGDIVEAVSMVATPNGRLEPVGIGMPFLVLIDYAHTPAALQAALEACRTMSTGRLIVVFGCGGDRDTAKRPKMGEVAGKLADVVIVTTDNPRSEDPHRIIAEIMSGLDPIGDCEIVEDRRSAIARAIEVARPGDLVLIAGKGHETVQRVAGAESHFDDHEVARLALSGRFSGVEQ